MSMEIVDPVPDEILARAAELRAERPKQIKQHREGTVAQEFAAALLKEQSSAIFWWSEFCMGRRKGTDGKGIRIHLHDAVLAHEWFAGEDRQFLSLPSVCRLLNCDSDVIRAKVFRNLDTGAVTALVAIRAAELCSLELKGEQLADDSPFDIPEPVVLGCSARRIAGLASRETAL